MNVDGDLVCTSAAIAIGIAQSSRNGVGGGGSRINGYGRSVSRSTLRPLISDVACPAVSIHIQRNSLASANVGSGSGNLDISTESINGEVGSNSLASSNGSGNGINAGRNRNVINTGSTSAPAVGDTRQVGGEHGSGDDGLVALTNHIVAVNLHQGRSRVNGDGSSGSGKVGNTTVSIHNCSVNRVGTGIEEVQSNSGKVLTRNFDTVEVPNIMTTGNRRINLDGSLVIFTNSKGSGLENRSSRFRINKNRNASHHLAICIAIKGGGNSIGGGDIRSNRNGLGGGVGTPQVGHRTGPTIGVGMQDSRFACADGLLNSVQNHIGTELGNGKRISDHSTLGGRIGDGHSVSAGRNISSLVGTTAGRPSKCIIASRRSGRQHACGQVSIGTIANGVLANDDHRRSRQSRDCGRNLFGIAEVSGNNLNGMSTFAQHIECKRGTGYFRKQYAIRIPSIRRIVAGIRISQGKGSQSTLANRGSLRGKGKVAQVLNRVLNLEVCRRHVVAGEILIQCNNRIVAGSKEVGVDIGGVFLTAMCPNPHVGLLIARSVGVSSYQYFFIVTCSRSINYDDRHRRNGEQVNS